MSSWLIGSAASAAILSWALTATAPTADLNVAVAGPLSGSSAALGTQMRDGAAAAVDALNAPGLLADTRIVLSVADDACDPKQAVALANRLTSDRVRLVVGHLCSASSTPASDVYDEAGVIQLSPGSTKPQPTERGLKTVFQICGHDDQQGVEPAEYIGRHYPIKAVAVLDDKSTVRKGIADVVEGRLRASCTNVMRQSYMAGEKNYTTLVSRMKKRGLQLAYIGGYHTEVGLIVRQAAEAGAGFTVTGNDPLMTFEFWTVTSGTGNGTLFTFMRDPAKSAATVVAGLKDSNLSVEGYTLYAAVQAWAQAMERAGSFNAAQVAAALRSQPIDPVIATVRFDTKGDNATADLVVYRWHDGIVEAVE